MPNLEGFKQDRFKGVITKTEDKPLSEYLETEEKIKAFKKGISKYPSHLKTDSEKETYRDARIEGTVTVITYEMDSGDKKISNSEFFNIPTITGWGRSKLKDVRDLNNLPYNTAEWIGKDVWIYINKEGYLRLINDV